VREVRQGLAFVCGGVTFQNFRVHQRGTKQGAKFRRDVSRNRNLHTFYPVLARVEGAGRFIVGAFHYVVLGHPEHGRSQQQFLIHDVPLGSQLDVFALFRLALTDHVRATADTTVATVTTYIRLATVDFRRRTVGQVDIGVICNLVHETRVAIPESV